jgi:ABC-2 type transport system ATP-binding protein
VCDRVAIVDRGEIVALDTPARLVEELGRNVLELSVDGDPNDVLEALRTIAAHTGAPRRAGSSVSIPSADSREALTERVNALHLSTLGVKTMTVRPTTLNDVFLHLTANGARAAADAAVAA